MIPTISLETVLIFTAGLATGIPFGMFLRQNKKPQISRGMVGIDKSTVSGRGAFALKAIKEGEIIERCPALEVTDKDIGGELLNYVFYGNAENKRLVAMGYGMLFNHSSSPNVAYYREDSSTGTELVIYALRDITRGEEMYYNYGDDWWSTRGEKAAF
jgi:SET domain-containing protein